MLFPVGFVLSSTPRLNALVPFSEMATEEPSSRSGTGVGGSKGRLVAAMHQLRVAGGESAG